MNPAWLGIGIDHRKWAEAFPEFGQFYSERFRSGTQIVKVRCVYQFRHASILDLYSGRKDFRNRKAAVSMSSVAGLVVLRYSLLMFWLANVDGCGIKRVLEMACIVLLDHLHTRPAVLCDLIDVGTFHEA
jgi:hypothetical protein